MATQSNAAVKGDPLTSRTTEQIRSALSELDACCVDQICRLHEYAITEHLSLKSLSQRTGISSGMLSQFFSGTYPGDWYAQTERVEHFFSDLEKKRIFGGCREFVETNVATALWKVCEKTRYNRRIQIIQSAEQLGKSRALAEYAANNNGGRTIMVTLQPAGAANPYGLFMRDLARNLHVGTDHTKMHDLIGRIREKLERCDLMIVDELHMLEDWPDRLVKSFWNALRLYLHADGKRGVVLVATNSDVHTLIQAFRRRTRYNVGQLLGRMCNQVLEIHADEIPIADVEMLVARYFKPRKATLNRLYEIATLKGRGHFGLLDDILSRAWADAQVEKTPLNDDMVMAVANDTMEDLVSRKELYK